ncbi:hypothetical protein GCM10010472_46050 [Pseudonocardia halophobica]|uniref:TM2 domain-containing protein n=1 Tax=Pseudonocardia halophobica TaxID=29401 RepID=A0A9W6L8L1_9PSEU|nr:hypothetical protein GCM10017577_50850 [Pseudonocardia halophobica]
MEPAGRTARRAHRVRAGLRPTGGPPLRVRRRAVHRAVAPAVHRLRRRSPSHPLRQPDLRRPRTAAPRPRRHPDAPYGREPGTGAPYSDKSKLAAGLLQLFLGGAGIGRFYTGHTGIAIAQLIVTIVTFGLGAVWGFVDGIVLLAGRSTDAQGRPLRP